MDKMHLSICIPTRNRVNYLRELLPLLVREVESANRQIVRVEIVLSDNASTDDTEAYLKGFAFKGLRIFRNAQNIGADRNFLACVSHAFGEYVWLFGDDDLLIPGCLERILAFLIEEKPNLLILRGDQSGTRRCYEDYGACVKSEMTVCGQFVLSHTLITANIFRKSLFDLGRAKAFLPTNYAHMYGVMIGLRNGGRVGVMSDGFSMRMQRAQFERWPTALCVKQAVYLWRIAAWFGLPGLRGGAVRLAANLPIEVLAQCFHGIFPNRGRI